MESLARKARKSYIFSLDTQELSDILSGLRSVSTRWPASAAARAGQLHDRLWDHVLNDTAFKFEKAA